MKWNIGICLYILHMYIYSFLFSVHFSPPFGYFGELGGIFCSLPLRLAARCGENRFPVFRPFWCSRIFCPGSRTLAWPLPPLKERSGCQGGRLSPRFSAVCRPLGRGSSTLFTLSSCRGWLSEEVGVEGEGICAGSGSLASFWHTSA